MKCNDITKEQAAANELMAWLVKENRKESELDAKNRREKICKNCDYWGEYNMCDYILREKHIRPCTGRECVEKGFFKPRTKRKEKIASVWGK